jgi:hypothetical protein
MTTTAIGANVHQPLDVHGLHPAQVTLDLIVPLDLGSQSGHIGIAEFLDASVWVHSRCF